MPKLPDLCNRPILWCSSENWQATVWSAVVIVGVSGGVCMGERANTVKLGCDGVRRMQRHGLGPRLLKSQYLRWPGPNEVHRSHLKTRRPRKSQPQSPTVRSGSWRQAKRSKQLAKRKRRSPPGSNSRLAMVAPQEPPGGDERMGGGSSLPKADLSSTHARMHARTHARTHTHPHTHTHTQARILTHTRAYLSVQTT